tara:strand:- start:22107 stop:22400 length:294 start_codon:yes stop_codon:yes gene_type:complete
LKAVARRGVAARKALVNRSAEAIAGVVWEVDGWVEEKIKACAGLMRENVGGDQLGTAPSSSICAAGRHSAGLYHTLFAWLRPGNSRIPAQADASEPA